MAQGTLGDAMRAMNGQLVAGDPQAIWSGAVIDSRQVVGNELFFALRGERTDGHRFVRDAFARGASAAIVHDDVDTTSANGLIQVDDTLDALHRLTSRVRERVPDHLVAITGSVGKTTTKELLALMLDADFRVARNPGNLNNLLGFPVSLLSIPDDSQWMVAEMGMSTPGELSRLSRLGRPDVAILTNVRAVHLEFFDSVEGIAEAKAEILEGLAPDGLIIANADDPEVMRVVTGRKQRLVRFGLGAGVDYQAREIRLLPAGGCRFEWRAREERHQVDLPLLGEHNVLNFLAAASCAVEVGVASYRVLAAIESAIPAAGRGEIHDHRGATIVDDSYNSNPAALSASLRSVRSLPGTRYWAVLGDMLELGPDAESYHRAAGREAAELGFSAVIGVGELSRSLVESFQSAGGDGAWFPAAAEAAKAAAAELQPGDVILVKGSRGVALDLVVSELLSKEERPS